MKQDAVEREALAQAVPPERRIPADVFATLMRLRDEFTGIASNGYYKDAASREWRELPSNWRMALLLIAGLGLDVDNLGTLASRSWQEMPPPEQEALRGVIRSAKRHLTRLTALAARV